jgi:protein KRI1
MPRKPKDRNVNAESKPSLFDEDEAEAPQEELKINHSFAKRFEYNKKREDQFRLQQLKDELDVGSDEDSEDEEEEDETGDALTDDLALDIFKTIAKVKAKDPSIYNKDARFFKEDYDASNDAGPKRKKAVSVREFQTKMLLESGGKLPDSDEEDAEDENQLPQSYQAEQDGIKDAFKRAGGIIPNFDDEADEWGGLFKPKPKSQAEEEHERKEQLDWEKKLRMRGEEQTVDEIHTLQRYLRPDETLDANEKFLRDYVFNKVNRPISRLFGSTPA